MFWDMVEDFLEWAVGLREDTASTTGSLHAKLAELRATAIAQFATNQKPRGRVAKVTYTPGSTTYSTALSVTGRGILKHLWGFYDNTSSDRAVDVKVTADGVVALSTSLYLNDAENYVYAYPSANAQFDTGTPDDPRGRYTHDLASYCPPDISFKTSLLVEARDTPNANVMPLSLIYEKE